MTQAWTRMICLLALGGALVAFTGCGGSDKKSSSTGASTTPASTTSTGASGEVKAYALGLGRVGSAFQTSVAAANAKLASATTPTAKLAVLDDMKKAATTAASGFAGLNPPAKVKAENGELVKEMNDFASVIDEGKTAAQNKDTKALAQFQPKLNAVKTRLLTTLSNIRTKLGP